MMSGGFYVNDATSQYFFLLSFFIYTFSNNKTTSSTLHSTLQKSQHSAYLWLNSEIEKIYRSISYCSSTSKFYFCSQNKDPQYVFKIVRSPERHYVKKCCLVVVKIAAVHKSCDIKFGMEEPQTINNASSKTVVLAKHFSEFRESR